MSQVLKTNETIKKMFDHLPKKDVTNREANDFIEKCKKIDTQIKDCEKNLVQVKSSTKKIMGHL